MNIYNNAVNVNATQIRQMTRNLTTSLIRWNSHMKRVKKIKVRTQ